MIYHLFFRIPLDRFRFPQQQLFPFGNPIQGVLPASQAVQALCATQSSPNDVKPRFGPHFGLPAFSFSQDDLDMVLYGYTKSKTEGKNSGHALSGLRSWDLSYGELILLLVLVQEKLSFSKDVQLQGLQDFLKGGSYT